MTEFAVKWHYPDFAIICHCPEQNQVGVFGARTDTPQAAILAFVECQENHSEKGAYTDCPICLGKSYNVPDMEWQPIMAIPDETLYALSREKLIAFADTL